MYKIFFYQDSTGHQPVKEYIRELEAGKSKDNRIKLNKIRDYMKILEIQGTRAGEPFVKHLEGEIWELRPLRDRILFAVWINDSFVLLSHFGDSWDDFETEIFTPEEIAASDLRVALINELICARNEKGITQRELEELSGVSQPVIARMESGAAVPKLDTVIKVLAALGKTLAIVPLETVRPAK